ncbi:hypothetical protein V499_06393 [Pseudogymnoascus sp. VKM F-103]|uniref:3',5'-cyclic-nucleotide phosphodiesterase pde1 n=1 Tax=Pseudogymnoascus verrucosus TaxID=342668 RepID=A0A1B8GYG0_9PEZI|nr:3',5'-cyclic-nucleotide phosphodiesterase pde1 [Pseudogymnoascus verrucosus]KFY73532.1 hypothetical protein V499_06393 [Pseudogymnoascus sp. VKM F-103]OBU00857.2 3',5'-cyclic-nucleotide phosphodiesterase pde1 [Pseudogymnoascus verrucosus]
MSEGEETPALQVIVLGSTGGPLEDNTTAFLVRSLSEDWKKGSVLAVDAGTHLSSIARIIEEHLPGRKQVDEKSFLTSGAFSGLELPHISAKANAGHITKAIVDTYLITHPHLDHISGLVVNTAALPGVRPKRIAALPSTISAFKNHIFNNVIWPNLSDENDGAGLVTYMRLVEGGSAALGNAESRGYVEICEGLSIKTWSVSHGHCMENHWHRGSSVGHSRISHDSIDGTAMQRSSSNSTPAPRQQQYSSHPAGQDGICVYDSSAYFIRDIKTGREVLIFGDVEPDSISLSPRNHQVWTDAAPKIANGTLKAIFIECSYADYRSDDTLFGHLAPRFLIEELIALASHVDIARTARLSSGSLGAAQSPSDLRKRKRVSQTLSAAGSSTGLEADMPSPAMKPELWTAREVIRKAHRKDEANVSPHTQALPHPPNASLMQLDSFELDARSPRPSGRDISQPQSPFSPKHKPSQPSQTSQASQTPLTSLGGDMANMAPELSGNGMKTLFGKPNLEGMLEGLKIVIIHVKDNLDDNEPAEDTILREMNEYEQQEKLGCHFEIARAGMSVLL